MCCRPFVVEQRVKTLTTTKKRWPLLVYYANTFMTSHIVRYES